jgi:hypothetical protein
MPLLHKERDNTDILYMTEHPFDMEYADFMMCE